MVRSKYRIGLSKNGSMPHNIILTMEFLLQKNYSNINVIINNIYYSKRRKW